MTTDTTVLTLCTALAAAGIWLQLRDDGTLIAGPTALVKEHPSLLAALKAQKTDVIACIHATLVHGLFGEKDTDPRFETDVCPDCAQQVYVITKPRRLSVHRLPGGKTVCPGSDRAQHVVAEMLMPEFYKDRCISHPGASITWTLIRGALSAWCVERDILLPPPQYLWAWLDTQYPRKDFPHGPVWQGFTLQLAEWFGEDETPAPQQTPYQAAVPQKVRLRA